MPDYLDTSAFIKLVRSEPESPAPRRELVDSDLLSSALLTVEGRRAARRYGELAAKRARAVLTAITLIPLDEPILEAAAELDPAELRSRDRPAPGDGHEPGRGSRASVLLRRSAGGRRGGSWHRGLSAALRRRPKMRSAERESGVRAVSKLATALGVPAAELFDGIGRQDER